MASQWYFSFIKKHFWLFFFVIFAINLNSSTSMAIEWGEITTREWNLKAPLDYPEANAVVIFDSCYAGVIQNPNDLELRGQETHFVRIKILNKAGVDETANVEFSYHKSNTISEFKAHTIHPDGSTFELSKDDLFEKKVNDYRFASFAFVKAEPGTIIEYTYTLYRYGIIGNFWWDFSNMQYTLKSVFSFEVTPGFHYSSLSNNVPPSTAVPSERKSSYAGVGKTTIYTWQMSNIMPFKREPYMGSFVDFIPSVNVQVSSFTGFWYRYEWVDDWLSLGEAFTRSINDYKSKPRGFRKKIREITKDLETKYDKSKAIYNYVINNIITRQDDYGLYFEHDKMDGIFNNSYGRACEKNILMIEMFKEAKIKAWPVLISTTDHGKIDPKVFKSDQFNHLIVYAEVEQGGIYLDATSKYSPYGTLAPICRADIGLIVDDDKSELIHIITSNPNSMRLDFNRIYLDDAGHAVCSLSTRFGGYMASEFGGKYETGDPDDFVNYDYLGELPLSYTLDTISVNMKDNHYFEVNAVISSDEIANIFNNNITLSPLYFMFDDNPFESESRHFPVNFKYPFAIQSINDFYLAPAVDTFSLPEDQHFQVDGAQYISKAQKTPYGFKVESKMTVTKPIFSLPEYRLMREFFNRVAISAKEQIVAKINGAN